MPNKDYPALRSCPFCGGEADIFEASEDSFCALCADCGVETPYQISTEEAIAAWNSRTGKDINVTTNNAVPVVRCVECKHYNTTGCSVGFGWCESMDRGVSDDFYCSCGEKMEGKP